MRRQGAREFVARLKRLDCCAVSDALDKLHLTGVAQGLVPLTSTRRICGRHIGTTAIESAEPGDIIVVEQRSGVHAASWGGILALGAKLRRVAGVIADGPARDIDEARQHDFPVFARGATPVTARGRIVELANNVPVMIGDVEVRPGDYAIADASGVAFISAANIETVLATAEEISRREAAMIRALRKGRPITEVMGATYENMLKS
jgi:4-hydroxy-4-methyl-2-oxoglutarate aldolase